MTCYAVQALLGIPYPVSGTGSASGDAVITRSPTGLAFYCTEDGDDPLDQWFYIWNDGDGTMAYTVSDDQSWLSVSPTSGSSSGEHDKITASVDSSGLSAGNHSATITIESDDADNSPRTVSVTVHVAEAADDTELAVAPEELSFTSEGGDDPSDQFFELWNAGPGNLEWEVDVDEDWLDVSPSDGDSDGEHDKVTVSVDASDLDADDYEATITISSDDAENSPRTVTVLLEVTGSSSTTDTEIAFSPSRLTFDAVDDGDDPDGKSFQIWNSGDGRLYYTISTEEDWLFVSPESGTSSGEKDTIDVEVDISRLNKGTFTGEITVENDDDSSNSETIRVTLTIEPAETETVVTPVAYLLVVTATPDGGGTVTRSVAPGASGYEPGTTVVLTAIPSPGYAFVGWSGEAGGSAPTATIVMSNNRSVVATFLRFDTSGLTNVRLAYASPDLAELTVMPYPVSSIPSDPPGFHIVSAYVVQPQGSGTFALEFDQLTDAENAALFQVVNGEWTQIPRTVMDDSTLQVTLPVAETVVTLAYPGSASSGIMKSVTDFFGSISMDSTTLLIVAIIGALVLAIVLVLVFLGRRSSY